MAELLTIRFRQWWPPQALIAVAFCITLASSQPAHSDPAMAELIGSLGFANEDVGFVLVDLQSGRSLAENEADELFMPASVAKLATAYAAERILGPEFRFSTLLLRNGADLYLKGGGDPSLTVTDLSGLVQSLPAGISQAITGFFYDDSLLPEVHELNERQPMAAVYNAGFGALNVDFNRIAVSWSRGGGGKLEFSASSIADELSVPTDWITFSSSAMDLPEGSQFVLDGTGADRWLYTSKLPDQGNTFLPVKNPGLNTALVFRQVAKLAGLDVPIPQRAQGPKEAVVVAHFESQPLMNIVAGILRYSNNISAELIGLATSHKLTGQFPTIGDSCQTLTEWLQAQRPEMNWRGFHLENHSGFSSETRVSPRQMVGLLELLANDSNIVQLLPAIPSETAQPTGPQLIGKSGTMDYALGFAGYIVHGDAPRFAFAIFVFDRKRRAELDASMDRRIVEPSPEAREWISRARTLEHAVLQRWIGSLAAGG
jgi:D-alanyl-D-alanine carboxypeptidase/D-alanyl-D-alanine-endopeptidase (penicillin-binding protein 4)